MAVNLTKGQRIDLTKSNPTLNNITVGLGWDEAGKNQSGGFLGGLFGNKTEQSIDCDASVIMLQNDRFVDKNDLVYFGNLKSLDNSIVHTGDNLTGEGEGDDEVIKVNLKQVNQKYNKLVFIVNIYQAYQRKQHFGMIENAFIRIMDDKYIEIARYNLTENYEQTTGLIVGELYRSDNEWKFAAVGQGLKVANISEIIQKYQK